MEKIAYTIRSIIIIKNLLYTDMTSYLARITSRILITRIDDFIDLSRRYNNAHTTNVSLKRKIKNELTTLDNLYQQYLQEQRHKFSAHFQDKNLLDKIQLWGAIDEDKIAFFYTQIIDIYNLFNNHPNYYMIDFTSLDLSVEKINRIKELIELEDSMKTVKMSSDSLALSRPNVSSAIPCHPIPMKMTDLNSIAMFYKFLRQLYEIVKDIPEYENVIKAQLATDLISFKDNLIHKTNSQDTGLDHLIEQDIHPYKKLLSYIESKPNQYSLLSKWSQKVYTPNTCYQQGLDIINNFKTVSNEDLFTTIVELRNKLGAHIDRDLSLSQLLRLLNAIHIDSLDNLLNLLYSLFYQVGQTHITLRHLTYQPMEIKGITDIRGLSNESFYNQKIEKVSIPKPKTFSSYNEAFEKIIDTGGNDEDAINFFNQGFQNSQITCSIDLGKNQKHTFTDSSMLLINRLTSDCPLSTKLFLLKYIKSNKGIIGEQCDSILLFSEEENKNELLDSIIFTIGETGHAKFDDTFQYLSYHIHSNSEICINAFISLLKIDLRDRSLYHANHQKEIVMESRISKKLKELIPNLSIPMQIIIPTLMLAEIIFGNNNYHKKYSDSIYMDFLNNTVYDNFKKLENSPSGEEMLIIETNHQHFIYTCTLNALSQFVKDVNLSQFIHILIANGHLILNYKSTIFLQHKAYSHFFLGDIEQALTLYDQLIRMEPANIDFRLEQLEYIVEKKDQQRFEDKVKEMYQFYKVEDEVKQRVEDLKTKLANV